MAPTATAALTYSKDYLSLNNKLRKPMVEKMRRDHINSSIEQLKSLLSPELLQQQPESKLEKADILEMTVFFLKQHNQHQQQPMSSAAVSEGFSKCVQEIRNFLSQEEVMSQSQRRLLSHFQNLQPSSDKSQCQSVVPHLLSPGRQTSSKEETQVTSALWRPW